MDVIIYPFYRQFEGYKIVNPSIIHTLPATVENIFLFGRKLDCIGKLMYLYISFGMLSSFLCLQIMKM